MNSHCVRWLGEQFSRLNTGRFSLKAKAMVDEWLPTKGSCYPEVFKIWGYMAGDEGLVFYLLNIPGPQQEGSRAVTSAAPSTGQDETQLVQGGAEEAQASAWDPPGTTIHLCPQTPALHTAKTRM